MKYDWKVIGHEKILTKLERDLENNNIASATLLVGPEEIGKSRVIKTMAKILSIGKDFSHNHEIAQQIEKNIYPDVITVGALWQKDILEDFEIIAKSSNFDQSERKKKKMISNTISIDDVLSFSSRLYEKSGNRYKICLIKDAHRMNSSAANAFLKILEEPPEKTIFIMTAKHEDLLPKTVISRTRVFQMNLVPQFEIRNYLDKENTAFSDEEKTELITLSQGRPARLNRFLKNPDFLMAERNFYYEIAKLLAESSLPERLKFAEDLAQNEEREINEFFNRFIHFLRSILIEKINNKNMPLAQKLSFEQIIDLILKTALAEKRIIANVNKRLTLENLFISFP